MKITKKFKGMLSLALTAMLTLGSVTANATTPNEGTVLPEPNRKGSITIHKYGMSDWPNPGTSATGNELNEEDIPTGAVPLKGIQFTVQEVIADENGSLTASNSSEKYSAVENKDSITLTTNENGTDTTGQIAQGTYLVTELPNASITTPVEPFIVNVPMTNPTGDGWIYDVHVYPKNVVKGDAYIDKDVTQEGNDHNTANIGEEVKWIIKPSIPKDVYHSKKYKITDELDSKLNYTGNLKVYYLNLDGEEVVINTVDSEKNVIYEINEPNENKDPNMTSEDKQTIEISFTKIGREFLGGLYEQGIEEIRISFNTIINGTAELGQPIYNNATLDYQNSFSTEDKPSDPVEVPENQRPEVHTGGVTLLKVDAKSKIALQGAEFMIYATKEDALAGVNPLKNPLTGEDWVEKSGSDGIVRFEGLSYGEIKQAANSNASTDYWIVETKSPTYIDENGEEKHYNLLKEPLKVTVHAESHKDKYAITVKNSKFSLPVTGGVGTVIFTLGGLAIMGAAAFLYMRTTRRA